MERTGCLEKTSLPSLLLQLYRDDFSGVLRLKRDRVEKSVLFQEGIPLFAESNLASESLGVQLLDSGKITRAQHAEVSAIVKLKRCREGKALLDLGLMDPKTLFVALKDQLRLRVTECFGWARGTFEIDATEAPAAEAQPFRADVFALAQEGIETHWNVDRILADLGPRMGQYGARNAQTDRLHPRFQGDDALHAFVDALDGERTFWKALQLATTPRALAAAWVLDAAGAIDFADAPAAAEAEAPSIEIEFTSAAEQQADASQVASARAKQQADRRGAADDFDEEAATRLGVEISNKHARLKDLDYYELLDISLNAATADVKRAYLHAAKTYHPDALARARIDDATRRKANRVFAEIGKAYTVLSDPERRADYDSLATDGEAYDANRLANAESLFRKGEVLLRQGNFAGALQFFKPAVEIWPEEAEYQSALGWVLYKKMPSEPEPAREHIAYAARLAPDNGVVLFRLSVVLRALGEIEEAAALAARARSIDPNIA